MVHSARPKFTYLGHSTVLCDFSLATPGESSEPAQVLFEPWVASNPSCPQELQELGRLDAILITHGHFDHMDDAVELAKRHRPQKIVGNWEICHWLDSKGVENTSPMNLGGSQRVLGAQVSMVRADHSSSIVDGDLLLDGGAASGYVVKMPNGYTFYHAGDTALFSDMQLIAELYRPELAFLPIGDHFTMDPHQAARACRFLGVRHVIPVHWGTFPALTGTPKELEKALLDLGVNCEVIALRPGESY